LDAAIAEFSLIEQAKIKFDLAIVSVLLDAGAGADWQYANLKPDRFTAVLKG
jgi:Protein of unknown function (DUF1688).